MKKEAESSHSTKFEPKDSGRQTCMAQLLFLQKQVAVLGEQEKGDLGSLTRSPFGIGCLAGFEQEGKVEGLLAQERACVSRMARQAPGVGCPGKRPDYCILRLGSGDNHGNRFP